MLTPEPDEPYRFRRLRNHAPGAIWAVVDSANLPPIQEALLCGERQRALQLLSDHARSLGSLLD